MEPAGYMLISLAALMVIAGIGNAVKSHKAKKRHEDNPGSN